MNIVLDSNVLFSAIIKDSLTRRIILEYDGRFLFPSYIFMEIEKHKPELMMKSRLSSNDFNGLLEMLLKKVIVVPSESLDEQRDDAARIVKDIDINDVLFIACALAYPGSLIWRDDRRLKNQDAVRVLNTGGILRQVSRG